MEELQKQEDEWKRKEDELRKKEKVCSERPNISSIVHLHGWEQMPIKYSLSPQRRFGENPGQPLCMWLKLTYCDIGCWRREIQPRIVLCCDLALRYTLLVVPADIGLDFGCISLEDCSRHIANDKAL